MPVPEKRSFNQAYADARKNQQLEFEWNGQTYNTRSKEEDHRLWLTKMYRMPIFPNAADDAHNRAIDLKLNVLDRYSPTNKFGLSAKYDYLYELNQNLSPEHQLTMGDLDDWDPYGLKTRIWAAFGSRPGFRPDLSMLNTNQIHNWIATSTNKMHPDNPHQLTTDRVAQWDPDGSKSKAIIFGENPEGLQNLYGKDWLHYKLASMLNDGLKTNNPEFSKLFQYDPSSFSSYDPDGKLAANYLMYNQAPPEDDSAMWDQVRQAELNLWEQRFNAARNHPIKEEFRTPIPEEYQWTNEDSPTIAIDILRDSYKDQGRNWQYYVDQDPLAKKYQLLTKLNPEEITSQEFKDGVRLSHTVPLTMLGAIYGGSALLKGFNKLDRFATRNLLKFGSKYLNYSKTPGLINGISRYGVINGAIDSGFLGHALYDVATNPNASWTDVAWSAAPFALMSKPGRTALSWIGNTVVNGWRNPYIKSGVLSGLGVGGGVAVNNWYNNVYKPARPNYLSFNSNSGNTVNSRGAMQYSSTSNLLVPELKIPGFTPKIFNSEIKLP